MKKTVLYKGAEEVKSRDALEKISVPLGTKTFQPVSHYDLVIHVINVGRQLFHNYKLRKEQYCIARKGSQLFGIVTFENDSCEYGIAVGINNSYDKSIAISLVSGIVVLDSNNPFFHKNITLSKHSKNLLATWDKTVVNFLFGALKRAKQIADVMEEHKRNMISRTNGAGILGILNCDKEVLSPRQYLAASKMWRESLPSESETKSLFDLYNYCSEALKTSPPKDVIERYVGLYKAIMRTI